VGKACGLVRSNCAWLGRLGFVFCGSEGKNGVRDEARGLYRGLVPTFVQKSRLLRDRVFSTEFGSKMTGGRGQAPRGGARVSAV